MYAVKKRLLFGLPSLRAMFVIVCVASYLHLSTWPTVFLIVGYLICEDIDKWRLKWVRQEVAEEEFDWEQAPDDSKSQLSGGLSRVKLDSPLQIIVTRVLASIARMP
jgi:hypothetical protein